MDASLHFLFFELLAIIALVHEISGDVHPRHRDIREEYRQHVTVRPLVYASRDLNKTPLTSSLNQDDSSHHDLLSVSFKAFGRQFFIQLNKNRKLLPASYIEKYFSDDGTEIIERDFDHNVSHCFFHGKLPLSTDESSHAAFSTCSGLSGYVSDADDVYYVEPKDASLEGDHYVFRESDSSAKPLNLSCGHTVHSSSRVHRENINKAARVKRAVRWPYDATPSTKIVELYVVNDYSQYAAFDYKRNAVSARTKEIVNIVSSLYRPLGIYVVLVGIEIWTTRNQMEVVGEAHQTMNNFLEYRRTSISPNHPNDNAQLIIGETLGDGVVGKAPIMTICTWQYSGGVNMDHNKASGPVATTLAHEIGHNFGLNHDQSLCVCPHKTCIMAPSSGGTRNPTKWSSCSKDQFEEAFLQGMDYCLHNIPSEAQFSAKVCGNGFVEGDEECDCGLAQDCTTHCCNASTCKLNVNATCATGECCDLDTCQVRPASYLCRPQSQHCDLSEHCNGRSEFCPTDVHKADGHECSRDGVSSYCYRGNCETHDAQCKKLWGQTGGQSNAHCYSHFNPMGLPNGHCSFYFPTEKFEKCAAKDVMCGMLHCEHRNEKLMFWKEALAYTLPEAWVMVNRSRHDCKAAILDVGLDMPDPGMVPDGAKCADQKICVSHVCTAIQDLEVQSCPHCNGHGVCNSLGQCHCDAGWAPPYCNIVGQGGSEHSGPVSNNTSNQGLIVGLCLFFLLILPLLAILIFIGYTKRETLKKMWARGPGHKYRNIYLAKPRNDIEQPPAAARPQVPQPSAATDQRRPKVARQPSSANRHSVRTPSFTSRDISNPHLDSSTNRKLQELPSLSYKNTKDPVILGIPEHASPTHPAPPPPGEKRGPPPRPKNPPSTQNAEPPSYENAAQFEDIRLNSPDAPDDRLYCNVPSSANPPLPPKNVGAAAKKPVPSPKRPEKKPTKPTPASRVASMRQKFSQSPSSSDNDQKAKPRWSVNGERPVISDPIPLNSTHNSSSA